MEKSFHKVSYSKENLKKLRSLTEVAISECIKALDINNDDFSKALAWLKERSLSSSKSSKSTSSEKLNKFGLVRISNTSDKIVAFSLKCESDFVAMNSLFAKLADDIATLLTERFEKLINCSQQQLDEELKGLVDTASYSLNEKIYIEKVSFFSRKKEEVFGQYVHHNQKTAAFVLINKGSEKIARELAIQVVANSPVFLAKEDIPHEVTSVKLEEFRQLVSSENPLQQPVITEKIVNGKFNKWISEICFLEQNDFREPSKKIKNILHSNSSVIKINSLFRISIVE